MERDVYILASDFRRVAASLSSLAKQLQKERLNGSLSLTRGDAPAAEKETGVPAEQAALFSPLGDREGDLQ